MLRLSNMRLTFQRLFFAGIVTTLLVPFLMHEQLNGNNEFKLTNNDRDHESFSHKFKSDPNFQEWLERVKKAVDGAEKDVLDFFGGEPRALKDGVPIVAKASNVLGQRLAYRMSQCFQREKSGACTLRVVFVGSAQTSGRDNFRNQSYPFVSEHRLRSMVETAGLRLEIQNQALDNDLTREGPQTCHMCISNLIGEEVDIVGWDFDGSMQKGKMMQFEAFVRWVSLLNPALIMLNRDGPHGSSRRGEKRHVVDISPGHKAIMYEDSDPPPNPREEQYQNSSKWHRRWGSKNIIWEKVFEHYSSNLDFAAIDPIGAIWHLDHLLEFSNLAFDLGKPLPLVDCGYPEHPPPCDQHPQFILNHLESANLSEADLPNDTDGVLCGGMWGCRHPWYGGPHSHELRGELNALPIIHAFYDALSFLSSGTFDSHLDSKRSPPLPAPMECPSIFCNKVPKCITSYEPNLSFRLDEHLLPVHVSKKTTTDLPRLGISHFANNPSFQLKDYEKRARPLGYIDRKFAYRLAVGKQDAPAVAVNFTSESGPLVVCEPPCFSDECPPKRLMPIFDYATFELDDVKLSVLKNLRSPLVGQLCAVIAEKLTRGFHILKLSTNVKAPSFVMFSHVISF